MEEMQQMQVRYLGWKDPLEEGIATHSSILAWRIPMDRGAWGATVHGVTESDTTEQLTNTHTQSILAWEIPRLSDFHAYIHKYSCLGNPMDRGAWQATVHGVARV